MKDTSKTPIFEVQPFTKLFTMVKGLVKGCSKWITLETPVSPYNSALVKGGKGYTNFYSIVTTIIYLFLHYLYVEWGGVCSNNKSCANYCHPLPNPTR